MKVTVCIPRPGLGDLTCVPFSPASLPVPWEEHTMDVLGQPAGPQRRIKQRCGAEMAS